MSSSAVYLAGFFLVVALLPLHLGHVRAAQEASCLVKDLVVNRGTYLPSCNDTVHHGGRCRPIPLACTTSYVMVLEYVCNNGRWQWPDSPEFCSSWSNCSFSPPDTLHCDNRGLPNGRLQLPEGIDSRLTDVTVVRYADLKTYRTLVFLPQLRALNLSHNSISVLSPLTLQQRTLVDIDFSHNALLYVGNDVFPPFGQVRALRLAGNTDIKYAPLALHPTIGRCFPFANMSGRAGNGSFFGRVLEAPGCNLREINGFYGSVGLECVEIRCADDRQRQVPKLPCDSLARLFLVEQRCDGAYHCISGLDEDGCDGVAALESTPSRDKDSYVCMQLRAYLGNSDYSIYGGVLTLQLTEAGQKALSSETMLVPLLAAEPSFISASFDADAAVRTLAAKTVVDGSMLKIEVNVTTVFNPTIPAECAYFLSLISRAETTQGMASTPTLAPSQRQEGGGETVAAAAGLSALVLLSLGIALFLHRRHHGGGKRGHHKAMSALNDRVRQQVRRVGKSPGWEGMRA